jgi:hypothetical protein
MKKFTSVFFICVLCATFTGSFSFADYSFSVGPAKAYFHTQDGTPVPYARYDYVTLAEHKDIPCTSSEGHIISYSCWKAHEIDWGSILTDTNGVATFAKKDYLKHSPSWRQVAQDKPQFSMGFWATMSPFTDGHGAARACVAVSDYTLQQEKLKLVSRVDADGTLDMTILTNKDVFQQFMDKMISRCQANAERYKDSPFVLPY